MANQVSMQLSTAATKNIRSDVVGKMESKKTKAVRNIRKPVLVYSVMITVV